MPHVLIIEDDPLIAMNLQLVLTEHGATSSEIVTTQVDAVTSALQRRPEFITADVVLESGSGPEAVAEIHARLGPIPVIFVTVQPEANHRLAHIGRVFAKPMNEKAIARAFTDRAA